MEEPLHNLIVKRGFEECQPGLQSRFKAHRLGYSYEYCMPTDNSAMIIHFDTDSYLGRMTTWTRGTCYLEVLEVASGKNIFDRHYDLSTEKDFHDKLAELVVFLKETLETEQGGAANPLQPPASGDC